MKNEEIDNITMASNPLLGWAGVGNKIRI